MPYRTRRRLRRLGMTVGCLILAAVVIWVCWFIWLERFVVYTDDGVRLDFDYVSPEGTVQIAEPPVKETVAIHYNEGAGQLEASAELAQIRGYYATVDMLTDGVDSVRQTIQSLPAGSAVMLDLKNGAGTFYYSTDLDAPTTDALDVTEVDTLIKELAGSDIYLIARVPAFRDRAYGMEHVSHGLPTAAGYLWMDDGNCYWLNPGSDGAVSWLVTVANELRDLGFDEVVFTEFRFPETETIVYDSSVPRQEVLEAAAQTLVSNCSTSRFCVSFETSSAEFRLPEGRSRMYLTGVDADNAAAVAETTTAADKTINLVYLTEANDTRFDAFSVMRPMPLIN